MITAVQKDELTITYPRIIIEGMEYLSVEEAAQISGYNAEYIRRLIRLEAIKAVKKSRVWWIEKDSLEEYKRQMDVLGNDKFALRRDKED